MQHLIPGQHIHFVGIGGVGLSAIARILLEQGFYISGSDVASNAFTEGLKHDGAVIHIGHDPTYVAGSEMVIISSAVMADHVEVLSAQAQGIPVYKRSDIIASVMSGHKGIAIAGTHGKTTTTAMVTHIFLQMSLYPNYIIGGVLSTTGQNAGMGVGSLFVIEADEYDNMFHGLRPSVEVITNIEYDHPDFFRTPRDLANSFRRFVGLLPRDGLLIACADDPTTEIFANNRMIVDLPTTTYAMDNPAAHWRAENVDFASDHTTFDVTYRGDLVGHARLLLPGKHNVLNALAALIVASNEGVPFDSAASALATFKGAARRFEVRGERNGVVIIDDYAHHPTEIRVTLEAARQRYPGHEIWAVWQPHTFSRTQRFFSGYTTAFDNAHHVLITDIYASREKAIEGVSSFDLANAMTHRDARYTPQLDDAVEMLLKAVRGPAVILIMSAGDAPRIGIDYLARVQGLVG